MKQHLCSVRSLSNFPKKNQYCCERGSVSIEACILVPLFFFLIMFLYGILMAMTVRSSMTHALVEATKSLSVDAFFFNTIKTGDWISGVGDGVTRLYIKGQATGDGDFVSYDNWMDGGGDLDEVAQRRLYAYMSGNGQSPEDGYSSETARETVDKMLKAVGIDNLTVSAKVSDNNIIVDITYNYRFLFDGNKRFIQNIHQSAMSRLWYNKRS